MTSKTLIFAGIMAAIVSSNAMATGENTVTSKSYVDSVFQTKIPATSTTFDGDNVPSVVLTTSTPGTVGQIGVYGTTPDDVDLEYYDIQENHFLEYNTVIPTYATTYIDTISAQYYLDNKKQDKMTCAGWPDGTTQYDATHTDANCWLWNKN